MVPKGSEKSCSRSTSYWVTENMDPSVLLRELSTPVRKTLCEVTGAQMNPECEASETGSVNAVLRGENRDGAGPWQKS